MFLHFHLSAGARVSRHSSLPFFRLKTAKPANLDIFPFFQRADDRLDESVHHCFGLNFRKPGPRSDVINNVSFRQLKSPFMVRQIVVLRERHSLHALRHFVLKERLVQKFVLHFKDIINFAFTEKALK